MELRGFKPKEEKIYFPLNLVVGDTVTDPSGTFLIVKKNLVVKNAEELASLLEKPNPELYTLLVKGVINKMAKKSSKKKEIKVTKSKSQQKREAVQKASKAPKFVEIVVNEPVSIKVNGVAFESKPGKAMREVEVQVLKVPANRVDDFKRMIEDNLGEGVIAK